MVSKICMGEVRSKIHANRASSQETVETTVHLVRNVWMDRWRIHLLRGQDTRLKLSLLGMGLGHGHLGWPLSPLLLQFGTLPKGNRIQVSVRPMGDGPGLI